MPTIWDDAWLSTNWNAFSETWAGSAAIWAWNNGQDLARIGFGVVDVVAGIAMGTTGIGGVPGVALMYIGIDQILTGSLNLRYGRVGKNLSVIENAVFQATGNETLAVLTPGVLSLGLGWYGSIARAAAREGAAGAAGAGGLTMLGGSPVRLASTADELSQLYNALIKVATGQPFLNRARGLGYTAEQIAQLPVRITQYFEQGMLGWMRSGGWATENSLLIGRGGVLFSYASRMRHELAHVLDEIAKPGLMMRSLNRSEFGFMGFYRAEMVAFGIQLGRYNPARPWLAGFTASHNRFGLWGSVPFLTGTVYLGNELSLQFFSLFE